MQHDWLHASGITYRHGRTRQTASSEQPVLVDHHTVLFDKLVVALDSRGVLLQPLVAPMTVVPESWLPPVEDLLAER